jgi:hypothetical protein
MIKINSGITIWEQPSRMYLNEALKLPEEIYLNLGIGIVDWILPNKDQLILLMMTNTHPSRNSFWSSTKYDSYERGAWFVNFGVGEVTYYTGRGKPHHVRLLRASELAQIGLKAIQTICEI